MTRPTTLLIAACAVAAAVPARAAFYTVTTAGTISSGADVSGVFGAAGSDLTGRGYTLSLSFDAPGSTTYVSGTTATTSGYSTGQITVSVGGASFSTAIVTSYGSYLQLVPTEVTASNLGDDTAGDFVSVTNQFATAGASLPVSFSQSFSYAGAGANSGSPVSFSVSGLANASFSAIPNAVSAVPEPASFAVLLTGLVGVGLRRRRQLAAAVALAALPAAAWAQNCDPRAYGAVADGVTDNTSAIQLAIDNCASTGGGIVPITGGGVFVSGPIALRSHIHLQVDGGTTLKNTNDHSRYQPAFIGYPFQFANDPAASGAGPSLPGKPEAMISANGATDVGILGTGTIDGSGNDPAAGPTSDNPQALSWWALAAAAKSLTSYPGFPDIPTSNGLPRPWLIEFYNSSNVVVRGITVTNSPMWNLGLRYVTGATVTNYVVRTASTSPNTDGIDVVGSSNVTLANLDIATGDDNVAIKSGLPGIPAGAYYRAPYNLPQVPTSGVRVVNSKFGTGHGLSIGSETVNGINTISGSNISFQGTDNGFRIKTGRDRGNQIYGISMSNLTMVDVPTPLSISAYYPTVPTATQGDIPQTITAEPYIHDVTVTNLFATNPGTVRATATTGGLVLGLPESPVVRLTLNHVHISASKPTYMRLRNVTASSCNDVVIAPLNSGSPNNGATFDNEGGITSSPGCGDR